MFFDRIFARNSRRKKSAARGNYVFRSKRRRVRLDVHRLDLNPETSASLKEKRRKVMRWGFKFAVAALLVIGLVSVGKIVIRDAFVENDRFVLQHISVVTDGLLDPSRIIETSGLSEGMNTLDVPLVQVRERLAALPQVLHVSVKRGYPGIVFIVVEERHPVAWLECPEQRLEAGVAGSGCLLDASGRVLPCEKVTPELEGLPCISVKKLGPYAPGNDIKSDEVLAALRFLQAHQGCELAHALSVRRIDASLRHALMVSLESPHQDAGEPPLKVVFPAEGFQQQLHRLARITTEAARQRWQLATVDLLVEQNVPVTLRGAAVPNGTRTPAQRRSVAGTN